MGIKVLECDREYFTALEAQGVWQGYLSFTEFPRALHISLSPVVHLTNSNQGTMNNINGVTSGQSKVE